MPLPRHLGRSRRRQRGVAVITALLLTTLAISIVASLFWQQQVQVRSMENQRLHLQTRWILRGALDWSTLVLRQDAYTNQYTALTQVWATPLAETRLDQYIERERVEGEVFDASLSGNIVDATSRYNLRNLVLNNRINKAHLEIFQRLLSNLQINPSLAQTAANLVAGSEPLIRPAGAVDPITGQDVGGQQSDPSDGGNPDAGAAADGAGAAGDGDGAGGGALDAVPTQAVSRAGLGTPMKFLDVEDLLAVRGMTPEILEKLRPYVIVLPVPTPVNVNTAPAEVLAAVIPKFSLSEANALLARRRNVPWDALAKFESEIAGRTPVPGSLDVKSNWFLVNSRIRLDRAALNAQSLIQRTGQIGTGVKVVWVRQN
ncbi:type II secretion system minor pseudopilin GspK [Massilia jejuensis]|uniref:Type II secretion system minor pseudopilin GspK n=1 Tax=Massilia jejuensis TaxID=648894 RepID=A0ABW0PKT4_9BURK